MAKICLCWKWDSIFKLICLQEFLSDLSGWGVKIFVYKLDISTIEG